MNDFLQKLIDLKIPSIIIMLLMAYFGTQLLVSPNSHEFNSPSAVMGMVCWGVVIIVGVFTVLLQVVKEHYKDIIETQQTAMSQLSRTHTVYEQNSRKGLQTEKKTANSSVLSDYSDKSSTLNSTEVNDTTTIT